MIKTVISNKNSTINHKSRGFTIVELMVGIAILGIITSIALPSLSTFIEKMRVDNQISELNRLVLTARNTAINMGINVTLCPLDNSGTCNNDWTGELSVFIDTSNTDAMGNVLAARKFEGNDKLIKVKSAVTNKDKLQFTGGNNLTYAPTGRLVSATGMFSYCIITDTSLNRGILITASGRAVPTVDGNNDGVDEDRDLNTITCS
jgi:prepilin-type N-terminal cleavage/methylation domain-containing protein